MWNQKFQFDIHVPELVMVRFLVEDYDAASSNDFIGQYCLPLTSIQNGKKTTSLHTCATGWLSDLIFIITSWKEHQGHSNRPCGS